MVKEYLEKTRQQLIEERVVKLKVKTDTENHLKETIKFIQLLEESNDPNYAAFTPREVGGHNQKKIEELKEKQKEISLELENVQREISELDDKISEINSVIKVAKEDTSSPMGFAKEVTEDHGRKILEIQEKERQRIADYLQNSTVQNLTSLIRKSELCLKLLDVDPNRCRLELTSLDKILRATIKDTDHLIDELISSSLDDLGFDATIEKYFSKLTADSSVNFSYQIEGCSYKIENVIALTLFRIIQQACNNSLTHSNASNVSVCLNYEKDMLALFITDDGTGFDPSALSQDLLNDNSKIGISIMKESVDLLSGTFDIQSEKGKGCRILVKIPIEENIFD